MDDGAQQTPVERFGALENERDRLLATLEQGRKELKQAKSWLNKVEMQLAKDGDQFNRVVAEMDQMKQQYIASQFSQSAPSPPPPNWPRAPAPTPSPAASSFLPPPLSLPPPPGYPPLSQPTPPAAASTPVVKQRRQPKKPRIRLNIPPRLAPPSFHADEQNPHLPPIAERPGLVPNPLFSEADPLQHVIQPASEKQVNNGGITISDELTCIVYIDDAWYEVWCRFCGANFTLCNRSHQGGKQTKSFILGVSGLVAHFRQKHKDDIAAQSKSGVKPSDLIAQHRLSEDELRLVRSGKMTVKKVPIITRTPTPKTSKVFRSLQETATRSATLQPALDPSEREMLREVDSSDPAEETVNPEGAPKKTSRTDDGIDALTPMSPQAVRAGNDLAQAESFREVAGGSSTREVSHQPQCNTEAARSLTPISSPVSSSSRGQTIGPIFLPAIRPGKPQPQVDLVSAKRKLSQAGLNGRDARKTGNDEELLPIQSRDQRMHIKQ